MAETHLIHSGDDLTSMCYLHFKNSPLTGHFACSTIVGSRSNLPLLAIPLMNKQDLIDRVAETVDCSKSEAERMIETLVDEITNALKSGKEVSIAGLGIFEAKTRAGRTGRNPRTGESIEIPAMRVPKFRSSKTLKDAVK